MLTVRPYLPTDYDLIHSWWIASGEVPPQKDMMLLDSSFVLEDEGRPVMTITVYLTNTPAFAMVENLVKAPGYKNKKAVAYAFRYAEEFAKRMGYKRTVCFGFKEKLTNLYTSLGYSPALTGLTSLFKELS